jgi:hypothetical protein
VSIKTRQINLNEIVMASASKPFQLTRRMRWTKISHPGRVLKVNPRDQRMSKDHVGSIRKEIAEQEPNVSSRTPKHFQVMGTRKVVTDPGLNRPRLKEKGRVEISLTNHDALDREKRVARMPLPTFDIASPSSMMECAP